MNNTIEDDYDDEMLLLLLVTFIVCYNNCRRRHNLTRSAILPPTFSPWNRVLHGADDDSFLELTGMTRLAFSNLEEILFSREDYWLRRGRPTLLDSSGQLGLLLFYLNFTMRLKHLCLIFGVTPSVAAEVINKMLRRLCRRLLHHPASKIQFPDEERMKHLAAMVQLREPTITNVIGFVDGLSVPVQCSDDVSEQNAMYNGYYHDTTCKHVFAFDPEGKIVFAALNAPGSWHDAQVSAGLINTVIEKIGTYALCVDQGFPRSGELHDRFVGPLSVKRRLKLAHNLIDLLEDIHDRYVSLRCVFVISAVTHF
jgi:hypothetical protein